MEQKHVKIIGISIKEKFGSLKATELKFDENNKLTVVKGEVGSGKSTLQRALKLTTQGSNAMEDKTLLGDNVDIIAQLSDGDIPIFVGCRSKADGSLEYFMYTIDENGKKIKDVVIDGKKLTPASYLKSLQTALTWNLNALTSENPTVQRDISLSMYAPELEEKGVIFDKSNPRYVGSLIDKIEKAKDKRNYADMKRKEVGGIADDMTKKGIDFKNRMELKDSKPFEENVSEIKAKIQLAKTNVEQTKESNLNKAKNEALEASQKLRGLNDAFVEKNREIKDNLTKYNIALSVKEDALKKLKESLIVLLKEDSDIDDIDDLIEKSVQPFFKVIEKPSEELHKVLDFNEKQVCISKPEEFENLKGYEEIYKNLISYYSAKQKYVEINSKEAEIDTTELEAELAEAESKMTRIKDLNKDALAVNAYFDWKDENENVRSLQKDYFMKLTEIDTGVEGLKICPEYKEENGDFVAKGNDIYLMYDGSYDPEYFHNPTKELRKLAAYSDTQKPMICLLIQKRLLEQKQKCMPYLWIDQVPIDTKTKNLLDKMSEELGLWLFVNWTGDFNMDNIKEGEILIENGEIFVKNND